MDIGLQVNLGSIEPRLTTYTETLKIDVSASINSDGSFSNGLVTFLGDQAELTGGFFNTDSAKQNPCRRICGEHVLRYIIGTGGRMIRG